MHNNACNVATCVQVQIGCVPGEHAAAMHWSLAPTPVAAAVISHSINTIGPVLLLMYRRDTVILLYPHNTALQQLQSEYRG
jgi:hypothetical protein